LIQGDWKPGDPVPPPEEESGAEADRVPN
jgi:hypothetical protein